MCVDDVSDFVSFQTTDLNLSSFSSNKENGISSLEDGSRAFIVFKGLQYSSALRLKLDAAQESLLFNVISYTE